MALDDTDRRLLALLRDDARRSASSLAAELRVSRGTVQNRIAKLLREGAVQGFTVRLVRRPTEGVGCVPSRRSRSVAGPPLGS
jgi:DNA-binding Lrp family transcriptional regulator